MFEVTGNIHSMKASFNYVSHGGRLVFVGHTKLEVGYDNPLFHSREMTVMGSRNARAEDFTKCIACIQDGLVDPIPWITHTGPLESATPPTPLLAVLSSVLRCAGWLRAAFCERGGKMEDGDFMKWMDPESGVIKSVVLMPE